MNIHNFQDAIHCPWNIYKYWSALWLIFISIKNHPTTTDHRPPTDRDKLLQSYISAKRGRDERSPALHSWNDWGDRLGSRMPDRSPFPLHGWSHVKGAGASFPRSFSPCYLYKSVCKGRLKRFYNFGGIFHGRGGGHLAIKPKKLYKKKRFFKITILVKIWK